MQRILVAVIAIPIVIFVVMFRPIGFLGLTIIFAVLAVHEYYGLAKAKGFIAQGTIGMILTALIVLSFAALRLHLNFAQSDILALILIAGVIAIMTAELMKGYPNPFVQVSVTGMGALYVGIGMGGLYGVHEYFYLHAAISPLASDPTIISVQAGYFTIALLASIWICDSAAFTVGRKMGKHKIAPAVSPNKSWEGGIAGLVTAIIVWLLARTYIGALEEVSIPTAIAMGVIAGGLGQVGDFAESMLKRDAGVKDSSTLIPGHGGVLDRLDSILFVGPLAYLYLRLFGL